MSRLFINKPFQKNEVVVLSAPQSHYLTHVMRLKEGDSVVCFNGQDGDWNCLLQKQKKGMGTHFKEANTPSTNA